MAAKQFAEMIVDTVREGLLVLDLNLCVQAANESFYRLFGVSREETEGRLVYELGNGQWDIPELRHLLERILPERHVFDDFEVEHEFSGIGRRMLLLNARQLNHHEMVLLAIEDVTERWQVEADIRVREARYQALFDSIDQGYSVIEMIMDGEGRPVDYRFIETNPAFQRQTGLLDAEGQTVRELVPDLEDYWVEIYGRVAATGEPARFEQGSEAMGRWFDVSATRISGPGSRHVALLFTDITKRKGIEEARRESEQRYRALFSQAPAFIAVLQGPEHRFEFVNPAFLQLVGERDLLGKPVREALPEVEGQGLFEVLDQIYQKGEVFTAVDRPVVLLRSETGEAEQRYVDFVYQPLRNPDGAITGILSLGIDTTDRVQARAELDRVNRLLEQRVDVRTRQVRRLASKLSVAEQEERRRIAHVLHDDLQQQLFATTLTVQTLIQTEAADDRERVAEQLQDMILQATSLSRSLAVELSPTVLETDRLVDIFRWLGTQKRELYGLEVTVEGDADVADSGLRTLLYHLVREALFNVAKHAGTDRARIFLGGSRSHIVVRIEDEGTGFDVSVLEHEERAGGFGLSSIGERLELIGGKLEIDTAPGEGTRLSMTIPREIGSDA